MTLEYPGSAVVSEADTRKSVTVAEVEIRDIAETWRVLGFDRINLMRINIEGAEFPLREKVMASDLLSKVDCFLIQYHEWHPGAYHRRRKIQNAMRQTHRLVWDYRFVWGKWELK